MLTDLSLYHFKNYTKRSFRFSKEICCFYGLNGAGKTNVLDAIHYLCFTKSYFSSFDHQVVQFGKQGMFVKGHFENNLVECIIRENGKKEISLNGQIYEKNALHIGKFPAVIISPDDIVLINGLNDVRRRFLDVLLSQHDAGYLQHLIHYNKFLAQRNALLKSAKRKSIDAHLEKLYMEALVKHGTYIFELRKKLCRALQPIVANYYQTIAGIDSKIEMHYESQLEETDYLKLLEQSAEKDYFSQRTTVGIHKDQLHFTLNELPLKQHASQGQKKSFLFALKFAEYQFLKESLHKKPILLLDDIFEKLDEQRAQLLINIIANLETQVFITDTHQDRLEKAFATKCEAIQFEAIG